MFDREEALKKLRRDEAAKLEKERRLVRPIKIPEPPRVKYEPGVYEEDIHPPGEHWVVILMPDGKVGTVKFPDELWDDDVIPNLWRRFDAKVKRRLKVI